jgi:hypothetical protein
VKADLVRKRYAALAQTLSSPTGETAATSIIASKSARELTDGSAALVNDADQLRPAVTKP